MTGFIRGNRYSRQGKTCQTSTDTAFKKLAAGYIRHFDFLSKKRLQKRFLIFLTLKIGSPRGVDERQFGAV